MKKRPHRVGAVKMVPSKRLIKELKASGLANSFIAQKLDYKSHNTIKRWKDLGVIPADVLESVKKLLEA